MSRRECGSMNAGHVLHEGNYSARRTALDCGPPDASLLNNYFRMGQDDSRMRGGLLIVANKTLWLISLIGT
jgi:hypothetical protein